MSELLLLVALWATNASADDRIRDPQLIAETIVSTMELKATECPPSDRPSIESVCVPLDVKKKQFKKAWRKAFSKLQKSTILHQSSDLWISRSIYLNAGAHPFSVTIDEENAVVWFSWLRELPACPGTQSLADALETDQPMKRIDETQFQFPAEARVQRHSSAAMLGMTIETDGSVSGVCALASVGPEFGSLEAMLENARSWRFPPPTVNGAPTPVRYTTTMSFQINFNDRTPELLSLFFQD